MKTKKQTKKKGEEKLEDKKDEIKASITQLIELLIYTMDRDERMSILGAYCNVCGGLIMELFQANEKEVEMMCNCDMYSADGDRQYSEEYERYVRDQYGSY